MTKYNYFLVTEDIVKKDDVSGDIIVLHTKKTIDKNVLETYPNTDILKKGIEANRETSTIKNGLLKASQGVMEEPLIAKEEEWFKITNELFELEDEVYELSSKDELSVNESERLKELNGYSYTTNDGPKSSKLVHSVEGLISKTRAEMLKLEEANKWLKAYRGEETDAVRPNPAADAKIETEDVKKLIAHERDLKVRNAEDSIADVAKMVSLAFSVIATLWELTPDDAKDNVPAEKKGLIDYAVFKFNQIDTRADRQIAAEGTALVDKLYDREVAIADIVDKVKEETK